MLFLFMVLLWLGQVTVALALLSFEVIRWVKCGSPVSNGGLNLDCNGRQQSGSWLTK